MWERNQGELRFVVEHREQGADGGATLRVYSAGADATEWLRFDCFEKGPHYHLAPSGRDQIAGLDPLADNVSWTLDQLRGDLRGYLERAGCEASPGSDSEIQQTLAAVENAMRNPDRPIDDLDVAVLRSRLTEKWNTYPDDTLAAWVAEMDFPVAEPIRRVLRRATDQSDIGYPIEPRATGIVEAFAERMDTRFGWSVDPSRVEVLSEVVQGLYLGLLSYARPGEGAIVQTPIYPPFLQAVEETGRRLVENRLLETSTGYEIDFDRLRADADEQTRVLLFCNPHNPTGRAFTREELETLAELACERDWVVVTDEIHADLVFPGREFIAFGSLGPEVAQRTVTLTSPSKAFNIPGLRCAVAYFGSRELHDRFNRAQPRHVRGGIGTLGLYASIAAWKHSQPWLDQVVALLDHNRQWLAQYLDEHIPEITHRMPEATYLAWLDCRALELDPNPAAFFLENGRVALSNGAAFGKGFEGYVRINFATSQAILEQVLEGIAHGHTEAEDIDGSLVLSRTEGSVSVSGGTPCRWHAQAPRTGGMAGRPGLCNG